MQSEAKPDDLVIIHDAARPCLTKNFLQECICAAEGHDGVLPVLSMKDTVYYSDDGMHVDKLLKRSKVLAGQAPEAFRFGKYLEANRTLLPEQILQINGSTEPAVLAGMDIVTIPGDERNYKVTTQEDLKRFREEMEKVKMKAYALHGVNDLRYEEVDIPVVKDNEVLVNVQAAGVCGSDIPRIYKTGTYSFPLIPGHEFSGVVEMVGQKVDDKWSGKRVEYFR